MKFYTQMQVAIATFLGSPIAGGILMAHNAKTAGLGNEQRVYLGVTAVVTALLLVLALATPAAGSTHGLIPIGAALVMWLWHQKAQCELVGGGRFPNAKPASWWSALGISLLVFVGLLVFVWTVQVLTPRLVSGKT